MAGLVAAQLDEALPFTPGLPVELLAQNPEAGFVVGLVLPGQAEGVFQQAAGQVGGRFGPGAKLDLGQIEGAEASVALWAMTRYW